MNYEGKEISEELIRKAQECNSAEELVQLAKENGIEMTAEEAEAYLEETEDVELDAEALAAVTGGSCWSDKKEDCDTDPNPAHLKAVKDKNRKDD